MQTDCHIVNPGWEVEEGYEFFLYLPLLVGVPNLGPGKQHKTWIPSWASDYSRPSAPTVCLPDCIGGACNLQS